MKFLCTGNPNQGIAQAIKQVFPACDFIHKSVGFDLTTDDDLIRFKQLIKDYDVFINSSYIGTGIQEKLLRLTSEVWTSGFVFNMGSMLEFKEYESLEPKTAQDKRKLRETSLELASDKFRTTHMILSRLTDEDPNGLDPVNIANTIDWILKHHAPVPVIVLGNMI
jgi:hypothetical protein